jgi:hypothetical protein
MDRPVWPLIPWRGLAPRARFTGAVIIVLGSCAVYDSSLLIDASADVVPGEAGADVDPCSHAEPPPRPAADDPTDASDIEFVTVLTSIDFGLDGGVFGFDLDHTCTCPGPESCVPQKGVTAKHCDDDAGRDNAGGGLIQTFSALTPQLSTAALDTHVGQGQFSLAVRVRNYNGTLNDTQIALAAFTSNGTLPLTDAGLNPVPKHDGTDQWGIDPLSLVGTPPPYVAVNEDDSAYVAGGVVVASVAFPFGLGTTFGENFLRLDGALLVGAITKGPLGYSITGVVTGRWDTRNLLTGMQGIKDPFNAGQFLCGTDSTYQAFKGAICAASDISRIGSNDNTGAPCDALSLALGFTTEPALLGPLYPNKIGTTPCGATYSDQCGN